MPSIKQLYNICDFFGITPAQFFDDRSGASPLYCETANYLRALDDDELEAVLHIAQKIVHLKEENQKLRETSDG